MIIVHHPSDETLLRHAAGTLGAGPSLVVAAHLEACQQCRVRVAEFECIGGTLLEGMPPEPMDQNALSCVLDALNAAGPHAQNDDAQVPAPTPEAEMLLPVCLKSCDIGPWRWLGPGFKWRKVTVPGSPDAKVMLLKAKAGLKLPAHGHTGMEYMQVLQGSLSDQRGHYHKGDLDEAGVDIVHRPVVGTESECICLAALEGDTRLNGILGRLLRSVVGF